MPLAYSCTVKSTKRIEFLTIIPASAIQPIIEVAVSMGLLPGDADADAKYNVEKPKKEKSSKSTKDAKKWIKALGKKKQDESAEKETSEDKIDTNGLLKKEDKNDV